MDSASTSLIPNTEPLVQTASNSQSRLVHFSHTWTIDNFSNRFDLSSRTSFESNKIFVSPDDKQKFLMNIYPNGKTEESKGYLSLFLENTYIGNSLVVGCKFAILGDKGNKCNVQVIKKELYYRYNCHANDNDREIGFAKYISQNDLLVPSNGLLPNNKLTIYVEISYVTEERTTFASYNQASIRSSGESLLSEDYANLLKSGKLSDVVLVVSGTEFRAHKLVLSARSPVFCAMFEHDLMEKQQNRVEITDVKSEVFQLLLSYIYTGKCDSIEQNAEELLAAADKYELIALKTICEEFLFSKVSVESAPNLLLLADSYNADKLKTNVLDFMKRQSQETIQAMIKANPELLVDMFRYLTNKRDLDEMEK